MPAHQAGPNEAQKGCTWRVWPLLGIISLVVATGEGCVLFLPHPATTDTVSLPTHRPRSRGLERAGELAGGAGQSTVSVQTAGRRGMSPERAPPPLATFPWAPRALPHYEAGKTPTLRMQPLLHPFRIHPHCRGYLAIAHVLRSHSVRHSFCLALLAGQGKRESQIQSNIGAGRKEDTFLIPTAQHLSFLLLNIRHFHLRKV